MSNFTSQLEITPHEDGNRWCLLREFTYHLGRDDSGITITVPRGFITDFASTPRFVWSLFPPWGKHGKAAVLHDWLYAHRLLSRAMADAAFLEAMGVLGVSRFKRWTIYSAVRLFGWLAYGKGNADRKS